MEHIYKKMGQCGSLWEHLTSRWKKLIGMDRQISLVKKFCNFDA